MEFCNAQNTRILVLNTYKVIRNIRNFQGEELRLPITEAQTNIQSELDAINSQHLYVRNIS